MALPINIEDLLSKRKIESDRIEFKKGWNPDRIYRTIAAFANDFANIGGGYIVVGVEEENGRAKRPVIGIDEEELDEIQKSIVGFNHKIEPYYMPRISVESVDGKSVLVLWVPSGNERPYSVPENVTSKHSFPKWYVRNGSTTLEAKGEILDELREMANRTPFDDRGNPNIKVSDISSIHVMDYLRKSGSKLLEDMHNVPFEKILEDLDLLVGPTERRLVKNVAAMMFSEHPEKFFPYTQVDVVVFKKGRLEDPNNFTEITFKGPIPQLANEVMKYLKTFIFTEHVHKLPDRMEALRYFDYPYAAVEEAVINSLYHRDYQDYTPVTIEIEPDSVSVYNSGGPDRSIPELAIKQGKAMRARRNRNRRLGDFLKELEMTEGRNTGIPTIQRELSKNGSPAAIFITDADRRGLEVIIPIHPLAKDKKMATDTLTLKPTERAVLNEIAFNPEITYSEIAQKLSISMPTASRIFQRLKNNELIVRVGSDKKGIWKLTESGESIIS